MIGIQCLMQRLKKCIDNEGNFVDKKWQLCNRCAHDICKFNYNYNYSFWKKRGNYFHTTPHIIVTHHLCFLYRYQFRYMNNCQYTLYTDLNYCFMYIFGMNVTVSSLLSKAYHSALNINMCCYYIIT